MNAKRPLGWAVRSLVQKPKQIGYGWIWVGLKFSYIVEIGPKDIEGLVKHYKMERKANHSAKQIE